MKNQISLQTKLKAIREAGCKEPPFPYSELPAEYDLDISGVPMLGHRPAGDHRARQQRIETWVREVHSTWKRLPKKE